MVEVCVVAGCFLPLPLWGATLASVSSTQAPVLYLNMPAWSVCVLFAILVAWRLAVLRRKLAVVPMNQTAAWRTDPAAEALCGVGGVLAGAAVVIPAAALAFTRQFSVAAFLLGVAIHGVMALSLLSIVSCKLDRAAACGLPLSVKVPVFLAAMLLGLFVMPLMLSLSNGPLSLWAPLAIFVATAGLLASVAVLLLGKTAHYLRLLTQWARNNPEGGGAIPACSGGGAEMHALEESIAALSRQWTQARERVEMERDERAKLAQQYSRSATAITEELDAIKTVETGMNSSIVTVQTNLEGISVCSGIIESGAQDASQLASHVTQELRSIASNVEQVSENMNSIASAGEEMATSVSTVASAIEEMSASLSEVASNCAQAAEVSQQASTASNNTSATVARLGESAKAIGGIVNLVSEVAMQTNLLALNATIEAASAGDAGRGFAVVAFEVKELAKKTEEATESIRKQITEIQGATESAVHSIQEIGALISELQTISRTIATAVEEQTATTNEIAREVAHAATGSTDVARNVQEAAELVKTVSGSAQSAAKRMRKVDGAVKEFSAAATEMSGVTGDTVVGAGMLSEALAQLRGCLEKAEEHLAKTIGDRNG